MLLHMKPFWRFIPTIIVLCLSSCGLPSGVSETQEIRTASPSQPIIRSTMGDFVIQSVSLVDEVHEQKSRPGEKFLLLILAQPDGENLVPGEFSLEDFQKMIQESHGQIYVAGKDGSMSISNMAGWIQDDFTMGFTVPVVESYTLQWPDNSPLELTPNGQ